jgi:hypothetical protein
MNAIINHNQTTYQRVDLIKEDWHAISLHSLSVPNAQILKHISMAKLSRYAAFEKQLQKISYCMCNNQLNVWGELDPFQ